MRIFYILFVLHLYCTNVLAQNYYIEKEKAEKFIVQKQFDEATKTYNNVFEKYDYPFIKDLVAATCIAQKLENKKIFKKFIKKCLIKGMSKVELNYFIQKDPNDTFLKQLNLNFQKYEDQYLSSLNKELCGRYRELDKKNQLEVILTRMNDTSAISLHNLNDDKLANEYLNLINEVGFPSEKKCGLGPFISFYYTDEISTKKEKLKKLYNFEYINEPDIRERKNDSVFFIYSFKKRFSQMLLNHSGYNLLWHINIKKYKNLDSILLQNIKDLKLYPQFYAACLERNGNDYLLAWGSYYWYQVIKMKFKNIKKVPKNIIYEINKKRKLIGIRSIEADIALHDAIIKIEGLKIKNYRGLNRTETKNLLYNSLFTSPIP